MMYRVCAYSADGITYVSALAVVAIYQPFKNEGITWPKVCLFIFIEFINNFKNDLCTICLLYLAILKKFHGQYKFL